MSAKFESILDGIAKYLDNEIFPNFNDWQEILARVAVGRIFESRENIKNVLINNGIIRTLGVIDESGNVDIERIASDLKKEIDKKKNVSFRIPLFGNLKFEAKDVDKLMGYIPLDNVVINNVVNSAIANNNTLPNNATVNNTTPVAPVNAVNNNTNGNNNNNTKKENEV